MSDREDAWYTVDELARRLKVNPETVRRWIRRGDLQALALPNKAGYRISADDVRRFEQERMGTHGDG
jgi:excisionase family DNA binding protein